MAPQLIVAGAVLCAWTMLAARLRWALAVLIGVVLLVPGTLVVPNGFSSYLTFHRVVVWALALGLLLRVRRGDMLVDDLRPRLTHVVFAVFVVAAFAIGVGAAVPTTPLGSSYRAWMLLVDQLVLVWAALAAMRAVDDPEWTARVIGVGAVALAVVAIGEHFTGGSWANWFFRRVPEQLQAQVVRGLERRGSEVRVRGSAAFALELSWLMAVALPIVVASASRARRVVLRATPALIVLALVWSYSRSALVGVAVGALVLALLSRFDAQTMQIVAVGAVATASVFLLSGVAAPFQAAFETGSVEVREERLELATELLSDRPLWGVGFAGLKELGVPTTDSSYLLGYGDTGLVGLALFAVALAVAVGQAGRSVVAGPGAGRLVGAAAVAGAVVALVGAFAYDAFSRPASAALFWLLIALGISVAERWRIVRVAAPPPARTAARAALPILGLVLGLVVAEAVSPRAAVSYRFETLPFRAVAANRGSQRFVGSVLRDSACVIIEATLDGIPGADGACRSREFGAGIGEVRVTAPDATTALDAAGHTIGVGRGRFRGFTAHPIGAVSEARPTWVTTAPVWMAAAGLAAALAVPPLALRRPRQRGRNRSPSSGAANPRTPPTAAPTARARL